MTILAPSHAFGSVLVVPPLDETPYPTLGQQVCAFIENYLVFGPGDLIGQPARIDAEKRALIYRMYEVFPPEHPNAGRRRFKRVCISLQKGSAKSELAAWLAIAELDIEGPVRCDGFDANGNPVGRSVTDPYIPLMATSEDQSEELVFGAMRAILLRSQLADRYDIGLERIVRKDGEGKALPVSSAPSGNDGMRTTFQVADETHRLILPAQKATHRTMLANIPKRKLSDAWSLDTTTTFSPGENSVAEGAMGYALAVADGRKADADLFFFHRQACEGDATCPLHDKPHDLTKPEGVRAAVLEAAGPQAEWKDIDGICAQFADPTADIAYLRRVWLNQPVRSHDRAFDVRRWAELARPEYVVADGALITLGFDGARHRDSTAIVGTEVATGYQWLVGLWEKPYEDEVAGRQWEVSALQVDEAMAAAFKRWNVWRLYADPPYWEEMVDTWCGRYGEERVVKFQTKNWAKMAIAVRAFANAITSGELSHDGRQDFARHIGNAHKMLLNHRDDRGERLWVIQKERPDSPNKMDAAVAASLSRQARGDALAAGMGTAPKKSVYSTRGVLSL